MEMRDPSIHITKSQFEEILDYLEIDNFPTEAFFTIANKKAIYSRVLLTTNKKDSQKANAITLASTGDAKLVADLIYATRIKLKHRGVRKITEANKREWVLCKKLAEVCNTYCHDFEKATREGFIEYIEIGIKRMDGKYSNFLNRLISMYENITLEAEAHLEIQENIKLNTFARSIYDYFTRKVASSTGIYETFWDTDTKLVHFYRVAKLLKEKGWSYGNFIDAQFEALAFCNGIPHLEHLYGEKAIENYSKYMYKINQGTTDNFVVEEVEEGSLWDKIK